MIVTTNVKIWREEMMKKELVYSDFEFYHYDPIITNFKYFMFTPDALQFVDEDTYYDVIAETHVYDDVVKFIRYDTAVLYCVGIRNNVKYIRFSHGIRNTTAI